jgi:hypothetical protein
MRDYRRRIILSLESVRYSDECPVRETDRRIVGAWAVGGRKAEAEERALVKGERRMREVSSFEDVRRLQKAKASLMGRVFEISRS